MYGSIAYRTAREAMLRGTYDRLLAISTHAADITISSLRRQNVRLVGATNDVVLATYIASPAAVPDSALREALERYNTRGATAVELRDSTGRNILRSIDGRPARPGAIERGITYDTLAFGPLSIEDGRIVFEVGVPIESHGRQVGSFVVRRELAVPEQTIMSLSKFVGVGAEFFVGNADGSLWTDLTQRVDAIPVTTDGSLYEREGAWRLGRASPVLGSPWVFAVDLPKASVLAPARSMVGPFMVIALIVIIAGTAAWWAISSRITEPLTALTVAARSVASGDTGQAVSLERLNRGRNDEIGVLSSAFTVMTERVRESRENLEQQVANRTTELRDALLQLQNAQDELVVKERLATLGQLSSSVGHELRNPLGVMTNAVYLLDHSVVDASPKAREYIQLIRSQIGLSEKIVADLLDFARVKAPQRSVVHVRDLVDAQLARVRIPDNIRVERDIPHNVPAVHVDPVQIGQVLLNLITNAVQAMDGSDGSLVIKARLQGVEVKLDVVDTGPGVHAENLSRIFEPLFTTKARGIGLGLSVSRSLATANGGYLTASSEEGHGATFSLVLPIAQEK